MWNELNQNDQLAYLGSEGQTRVKGALTVLGAYGALREHPLQADISSPQQARHRFLPRSFEACVLLRESCAVHVTSGPSFFTDPGNGINVVIHSTAPSLEAYNCRKLYL